MQSSTATATTNQSLDPKWLTTQDWSDYTAEHHHTWSLLWDRRLERLTENGSRQILEGIDRIGLSREVIPNLDEVNIRLERMTGWNAVPVTGFIPAADFFRSLSQRRFPTTVTIRPVDQLDYLPEPDIFHDVFGHVPLHSDPIFADFLSSFGQLATRASTELETTWMARLFWFTVEFGLIVEDGHTKVYGSGLVSSAGDAANALGPDCDRRPFDLEAVIEQPFEIDHFQDVLFVIEDFSQLFDAVETMRERLG